MQILVHDRLSAFKWRQKKKKLIKKKIRKEQEKTVEVNNFRLLICI